jgi:hypothetical protein
MTIKSKDKLDMDIVIVDHHKEDCNTSYSITIECADHERFRIQKKPYIKWISSIHIKKYVPYK